MSQQELLKKVIQTLDDAGIQYLVTGSVASSLQGEPRSTHDIDLVVAIERSDAKKLVKAFPSPAFYLAAAKNSLPMHCGSMKYNSGVWTWTIFIVGQQS